MPTAFAVRALAEAVAALDTPGEEGTVSGEVWEYLTAACRACQFILMGLLAEMLVRTYHESQAKPIYAVRERIGFKDEE